MSKAKSPPPQRITTFDSLIKLAGSNGTTIIGAACGIHALTVENWRRRGIPNKYWDKLFYLYGVTPTDLHAINKNCKKVQKNG